MCLNYYKHLFNLVNLLMNQLKMQSYSHCDWIHEDDFQVVFDWHVWNSEKWTVLLVPAPWSSPCDKPLEWQENQRQRLARTLSQEWYTVLTMIPPGKPYHTFSGKKSTFSFNEYASCIESVLYRDIFKEIVTHIVTSSLWETATIRALQNDTHPNKKERKIIIWAPINSLQHVLELQQNHIGEQSKEKLIKQYALKFQLELDSSIYEELQNNFILTAWIKDLIDNWYKNVSIYGNDNDRYYTENNINNFKDTHFFIDNQWIDPFNHEFSEQNADEALEIVKHFLNDTYFTSRIGNPSQRFIDWFYNNRSGAR